MAIFTEDVLGQLKVKLLLDHPWFGSLLLNLRSGLDPNPATTKTAWVDGTRLSINPTFFSTLSQAEQLGVLAHEVMHCGLKHMYVRHGRVPSVWNQACDYAINLILLDAGLKLPTGALVDYKYARMSADEIYALLMRQDQSQSTPQPKSGSGDPGDDSDSGSGSEQGDSGDQDNDASGSGTGDKSDGESGTGSGTQDDSGNDSPTGSFRDASAEDSMSEHDWSLAAEQAAMAAKMAGKLPGGLHDLIRASHESRVDWIAELAQFIVNSTVTDVAWRSPNRRFVGRGMYLPGPYRENVGPIVVAVDTSASLSREMLNAFATELSGILHTTQPEEMIVLYCDTQINGIERFTPNDSIVELKMLGRGGTDLNPPFAWVADGIASGSEQQPVALIYLTDLEAAYPTDPGYPVLWVTPESITSVGPFGSTIRIPAV